MADRLLGKLGAIALGAVLALGWPLGAFAQTATTSGTSTTTASATATAPASAPLSPGGLFIGQPATFAQHMANIGLNADGSGGTTPAAQTASTPSGQAMSAQTSGGTSQSAGVQPLVTDSNPPEIQSLAQALKYDPDLIYEYVYNNIQTLPMYGSLKGVVGALVDRSGTSFDQAELMIALLNEAALHNSAISSPQFEFGQIWLTEAQLKNWLNSDGAYNSSYQTLSNGGFAVSGFTSSMTCAPVGWAWVQVTINGTVYTFDPAAKLSNQNLSDLQNQPSLCSANGTNQPVGAGYVQKTGIGAATLASAMGYAQSGLIGDAESTGYTPTLMSGSVIAVKGVQRAKVRADLTTYAENLISTIRTQYPAASTADIIGGASINPVAISTHQRWTSLPYQDGTPSAPASTMPTNYRTAVLIFWNCSDNANSSGIPFYTSDLYGHRFTLALDSSNVEHLELDGVAQIDEYNTCGGVKMAAGDVFSISIGITHPFATTFANVPLSAVSFVAGNPYLISNGWGPVSRAMIERHRRILLQNEAANPGSSGASSEPVIGEALAVMSYTWLSEQSQNALMTGRMTGVQVDELADVGFTGFKAFNGTNAGPYIDLPFNNWSVTQLVNHPSTFTVATPLEYSAFIVGNTFGSAIEHGAIEQTQIGLTAVSTMKLLDLASDPAGLNDTIYDINNSQISGDNSSYWTRTLKSQFTSHWTGTAGTADLSSINTQVVTNNNRVIAALQGPETVNQWTGDGWIHLASNGLSISNSLTGGYSGGADTQSETALIDVGTTLIADPVDVASVDDSALTILPPAPAVSAVPTAITLVDPVNSVTGAFENDHEDLSIGSGKFPYGLTFSRHYDSSSRFAPSVIGAGWSHSFQYSASISSDPFLGFGEDSPISGAAAIAATYVLQDILQTSNVGYVPLDRMVVTAQIDRWLMDQLTNNVVGVVQPKQVEAFVKLPDGTYKEPLGSSATLTLDSGLYTYTTEGKVQLAFNSAGNINTWTSPAGPIVTFHYNGSNQLTSVTNGMGRTLTINWSNGSISGVSDGAGRSVSYTYDSHGDLTKFTDAMTNAVNYSYDFPDSGPGRLTQIFYPSFPTTAFVTNVYDSFDRVLTQSDAMNGQNNNTTWNFHIAGSRTEIDDPYGTGQVFYLDGHEKVTTAVSGINASNGFSYVTTNAYDDIERLTSTTLPEGNVVSYTYDNTWSTAAVLSQNVLSITETPTPGSTLTPIVEQFVHDANCPDQIDTVTDPNGNITKAYYNTTCTLSEVDQPAIASGTPKTFYIYNGRGQVLTKKDPLNKVTTYVYDNTTEELLSTADDSSNLAVKVQYAYDAFGDVDKVTDPDNNATTSTYDNIRRVTNVTGPASIGAVTNTTYDPDGMVTQVQRATGNTNVPWQITNATYSAAGKRLTETDANNNETIYTYDQLERLATVTDAASRVTTYAYDVLSRQASVSNAGIQSTPLITYAYTPNGKRASLTDGNKNRTSYFYDGFDRLIQTQFPNTTLGSGTSDTADYEAVSAYDGNGNPLNGYDADGNPLSVRKRDGTVITIAYDALNRPTRKTYPGDVGDIYYTYDLTGRVLSRTYTSPTGPGVTYAYDTAGRLTQETTSTTANPTGLMLTYGYDEAGNRTSETWPDSFQVTYAYDALNRMTTVTEVATSTVLATYAYDPLSRRTSLTRANSSSTAWGYDTGSRLTSLTQTMPPASSADNLTLSFGYTQANQLQTRSSSSTVFDWNNFPSPNQAKTFDGLNRDAALVALSSPGYNQNGQLINEGTSGRQFTYDFNDRLTQVVDGATTAVLAYDPAGRLQQDADSGGSSSTTQFLYDGPRLSAEYDGSGNLLRRYVHGAGGDEPLVWYEYTSGQQVRNYLHADERGSVIAASNDNGAATTYAYGPYGEPQSWSGSRFAYTGQVMLPEVQLYHYKARAYDPTSGRFLQTDPVGYAGGSNLYQYASDDSLDLTDPTGNSSTLTNDVPDVTLDSGSGEDTATLLAQAVVPGEECNGGTCTPPAGDGDQSGNVQLALLDPTTAAALGEQIITDTGNSILTGAKIVGAGTVVGLAAIMNTLIAPGTAGIPGECPTCYMHYTDAAGYTGIMATGSIVSDSGTVYVTQDLFFSGSQAQAMLSLDKTPIGYFAIPAENVQPLGGAPTPVDPKYGQPGGGTEIPVYHSISIQGAVWVPLSK